MITRTLEHRQLSRGRGLWVTGNYVKLLVLLGHEMGTAADAARSIRSGYLYPVGVVRAMAQAQPARPEAVAEAFGRAEGHAAGLGAVELAVEGSLVGFEAAAGGEAGQETEAEPR
jgi:hypothetical protein